MCTAQEGTAAGREINRPPRSCTHHLGTAVLAAIVGCWFCSPSLLCTTVPSALPIPLTALPPIWTHRCVSAYDP
ncbi:MAG: hypothetical protein VYB08_07785, partial [Candidatus Latescibacterota bacterium]|nr:hypothetical protein [Candidatus Latescibacterota bacterium]